MDTLGTASGQSLRLPSCNKRSVAPRRPRERVSYAFPLLTVPEISLLLGRQFYAQFWPICTLQFNRTPTFHNSSLEWALSRLGIVVGLQRRNLECVKLIGHPGASMVVSTSPGKANNQERPDGTRPGGIRPGDRVRRNWTQGRTVIGPGVKRPSKPLSKETYLRSL